MLKFTQTIPEPNHELGYTESALRENLAPWMLREFLEWMVGQTVSSNDKGETVYYTYDVHRFLGIVPGKEVFD